MGGVLLGFALGAMTFTAQGRELADKLTAAAIDGAKKAVKNATKSAEQSTGAAGDDSHFG